MIDGVANNLAKIATGGAAGAGSAGGPGATSGAGGSSFSDVLKKSIDEVSRLQQDASDAVQDVATGKSQDVTGVMSAVEKSDLAFKTLLSIRAKLMDAYDEVKGISI
jgi:flagellar hook-basal body complex protein FliE